MKSRAERMREKQAGMFTSARAAKENSALVKCTSCGEESAPEARTAREDGLTECPSCGAAEETGAGVEKQSATKVVDPHRKFCGECGREWTIANERFFITCGHNHAERIEDPRKAKKPEPPAAGLQTRHEHHVKELDAKVVTATPPADPRPAAFGPGPATLSGNRLSIPWGEARMPIDQWNNFKCGGHIATVEVPEGADRVAVAAKMIDDLERIADLLFERQKAWYLKKLGILAKE